MRIADTSFGVLDVETTGIDPAVDRVVECALVELDQDRNLEPSTIQEEDCLDWEALFNPGIPIPPEASAVHHITDEDVKGFDRPFVELPVDGWFECDAFAAHFAEFEAGFIPQIKGKPIVCTYRLARHLWPTLDQYGNQYLRYLHKIPIHPGIGCRAAHRAYADAFVTACLLKFELQVLAELKPEIETVEQLVDWISGPFLLHRITFGKYGPHGTNNPGPKGRPWSEVPRDYLEWMTEQWDKARRKGEPGPDADTMFTVRHYLGL